MNPLEKYITKKMLIKILKKELKRHYTALTSNKFVRLSPEERMSNARIGLLIDVCRTYCKTNIVYYHDIADGLTFIVDGKSEVIYFG